MVNISNKILSIRKRLKGGETRTLLTNFLSLSFLQVASYIFPLLTVPYLAHVIGIERYGEIAFATAIMIYFQTLVDYGFVFSAVRDIARCRKDYDQVSAIYSKVMWARVLLLLLSFTILIILIILVPKFWSMKWVLLASFLMVIGHLMFPDWMFQALEKMKYITIFNVIVKLIFTGAVFIFIRNPNDYLLQPIFTSVGYIVSGIGAMWLIHKWGIQIYMPVWNDIRKSIKSNFDLFLNELVPSLYNSASVLLLGFFHGDAANGVFDAASRFNTAGARFFSIVSRTFYPFLSRRMDKHGFFQRLNLTIATVIAILLFLLAPIIIGKLFPSDFDGAIIVLRIISISLIFLSMTNIYGTNYLIIMGYEKEMRKITVISSITGIIIAVPLVYFYSYIGVALTITISRLMVGLQSYLKAHRIMKANTKRI